MIRGRTAGGLLATLAVIAAATGCGETTGAGAAPAVDTANPALAFAPTVRIHEREEMLPLGAREFLRHSSLEWVGGPCPLEVNVASGPIARPRAGEPVPLIDERRLGREPSYRVRPRREGCRTGDLRPETFTTSQRTTPFEVADRPVGLQLDEGFNLDLLTDQRNGDRASVTGRRVVGVPVYYAVTRRTAPGHLIVSYWMLFGTGAAHGSAGPVVHEGDWERVDVVLSQRGARRYEPLEFVVHTPRGLVRHAWQDLPRPDAARQTIALARASHTPRLASTGQSGLRWDTWENLRDVRAEPWFGYGGAWGAISADPLESGVSGPSPFTVDVEDDSAAR